MEFNMTYNSQEDLLTIPEYGRHVQNMIDYAKTIEDPKERQQFANQVVNLMNQMNPAYRNVQEYKARLWKHFFRIANYEIDVVAPDGTVPTEREPVKAADKVEYPENLKRFRHYGTNVQSLIEKAIAMEDGVIKEGFVETIASFMKMAYKNWNIEHYVSDEIIMNDLKTMSGGQLSVDENVSLDTLSKAVTFRKKSHKPPAGRGRGGRSGGRSNNRSNGGGRGRGHSNNGRRR